ncbi:WxcM-like domain-containing protein [Marinomonas piezotolerans]|nr:WxcM-like domain-containing protein [Marinomonas piezotolerans]
MEVRSSSLQVISVPGGDVKHALKVSESDFRGFGEAYFSTIEYKSVKGWKLHKEMVCNLVVPVGTVKFVVRNAAGMFNEYVIGSTNYCRLTIPPGHWFAFQGLAEEVSVILNISSIEHDPKESDRCELGAFNYEWDV